MKISPFLCGAVVGGLVCWAWNAQGAQKTVQRTVRQYAVTSANDFPQRDPEDWRLLGSNDGGKTWTTLDVRTGEVFPERHQRRLFRLAQPRAFGAYRLQIDRVRDSAAGGCVQLAEIEPLGETEKDLSPAPLPEDLVTAQGENPPSETRWQAFDGKVETKWLDYASGNAGTRASWIQWQYDSSEELVITNVVRLLGLGNRAARRYPVRIKGVIAGEGAETNSWCFFDGNAAIELKHTGEILGPGQHIIAEGVSEWTNGSVSLADIRVRTFGNAPPRTPFRILPEQPLSEDQVMGWVEVEGKIGFCSYAGNRWIVHLEDNGRSLAVEVLRSSAGVQPPPRGTHVIVQGICGALLNGQGESVAASLWTPSMEVIRAVGDSAAWPDISSKPGSTNAETRNPVRALSSIGEVRRLDQQELLREPQVKVRGVVTELLGAFIQEHGEGVEVWYSAKSGTKPPEFASCVEIEGRASWAIGHGPIVRAEKVIVLGPGKLPEPDRSTWSQLVSGRKMGQWVEIEAVVRSTDGSHLLANTEGGQFMATIRAAPAPEVRRLVDSAVKIRGVCVAATDSRGRMQGIQLLVPSLEYVEVTKTSAEPFTLPVRPIGSLMQLRGMEEPVHRVRVRAVLTYREDRTYFIQDGSGGAMAIPQQEVILSTPASGWNWMFQQSKATSSTGREPELRPGDHLEVVGFPEMRGYSSVLTEVLIRKVSGTNRVAPVQAGMEDILEGGLDASLVSVEAVVLRQQISESHFVLEVQSGERVFQAYLPVRGSRALDVSPGCTVRIAGVCQVEQAPYSELGRHVVSFKLLVPSLRDIVILQRPSWWTLKRALLGAGALLLILAIAGGWIGLLHRQVGERTKQLREEIAEHEKTEARLAEETRRVQAEIQERLRLETEAEKSHKQLLKASRLAGMAEVATSVLHNVGNVLNSANVLGSSIVEQLQRSKVSSVSRLAALLAEQQSDLGRFLTEDGRGQNLPGYLGRLGAHLAKEQEQLLEKTTSLREGLQHIKEIVAMQQNYARVSGATETVSLAEILEDALRMHQEALSRSQIEVLREFSDVPAVTIDRHKLLQILFNLLENARYACEESGRQDKQIRISLHGNDAGKLVVCVRDNGVGIPAENLTRIFAQDFSTRKGGHGFGLHSSMLTAQHLGVGLTAASDGPGQGATFALDIPLAPPRAVQQEGPKKPQEPAFN